MGATANFTFVVDGAITAAAGATTPSAKTVSLGRTYLDAYANGSNVSQIDTFVFREVTHVANTPVTLDLRAIADFLGNTVAFNEVRGIISANLGDTADKKVVIGNSGANAIDDSWLGASGTVTIHPLAVPVALTNPLDTAGYTCNASNKDFKITPPVSFTGALKTQHWFAGNVA